MRKNIIAKYQILQKKKQKQNLNYLKDPGERELRVNEGNHLQQHLDRPNVSIIPVPEVDVLSLHCHSLSLMGLRLKHLSEAGSCHGVWVKSTKQL